MVLMSILRVVDENDVRFEGLQRFEKLLNRRSLKGKKAGLELLDDGFFATGAVEKNLGAGLGLGASFAVSAKHDPAHI